MGLFNNKIFYFTNGNTKEKYLNIEIGKRFHIAFQLWSGIKSFIKFVTALILFINWGLPYLKQTQVIYSNIKNIPMIANKIDSTNGELKSFKKQSYEKWQQIDSLIKK